MAETDMGTMVGLNSLEVLDHRDSGSGNKVSAGTAGQ